MNTFHLERFRNGLIEFTVDTQPVSSQNKTKKKNAFKNQVQKITSSSEYIVIGPCWIAIDYYCNNIRRLKNPGVYDIDNIVKPTLDSLVGCGGLILDDVLVDRVTVNWVDTHDEDYLVLEVRFPGLAYVEKHDLKIVKSSSGWCFPISDKMLAVPRIGELLKTYFGSWDMIKTESEYMKLLPSLPQGTFVYFNKIKDKGYEFVDLNDLG